jgi:membrane dipeptidase
MVNRRQFLIGSGMTALAAYMARSRAFAASTPTWPPYAHTLAIDASAGLGRAPANEDGSFNPADLEDARMSGLSAVVLTLAPSGRFRFNDAAFETTVQAIAHWDDQIVAHPETFTAIRTGADLDRAQQAHKMGLIYGFQESSPLGEDIDRIDLFQSLGVRLIQLTHNRRNLVGDGCMEPGNAGLSDFGNAVIERLNARKVVVDLAHAGRRTMMEAIAASKAPVLISHTGCQALSDLPRCSTDQALRAMADRGGVAGIVFWPYLRKQGQPMAADVIAHIEHAINVCGEDHVGIGTDGTVSATERTPEFEKDNREYIQSMIEDGIFEKGRSPDLYMFIPDLNHVRRFETLGALLSARGHSDARIAKVLGGNFARVMREVWG